MSKLEERKRLILEVMRQHDRPIWTGDVASRASEQELVRNAFRALVEEGTIRRHPGPKGGRAYYWFAQP